MSFPISVSCHPAPLRGVAAAYSQILLSWGFAGTKRRRAGVTVLGVPRVPPGSQSCPNLRSEMGGALRMVCGGGSGCSSSLSAIGTHRLPKLDAYPPVLSLPLPSSPSNQPPSPVSSTFWHPWSLLASCHRHCHRRGRGSGPQSRVEQMLWPASSTLHPTSRSSCRLLPERTCHSRPDPVTAPRSIPRTA